MERAAAELRAIVRGVARERASRFEAANGQQFIDAPFCAACSMRRPGPQGDCRQAHCAVTMASDAAHEGDLLALRRALRRVERTKVVGLRATGAHDLAAQWIDRLPDADEMEPTPLEADVLAKLEVRMRSVWRIAAALGETQSNVIAALHGLRFLGLAADLPGGDWRRCRV